MLFLTACLAPGYECYALCSDIEIDQAEQYVLELSGRGAFQAAVSAVERVQERHGGSKAVVAGRRPAPRAPWRGGVTGNCFVYLLSCQ